MNDVKLRVSYGITGQQDGITNYGYIPVYTPGLDGAQYLFGGNPIYTYRPEAYNPELKWETTKSWNYGIDLAFLETDLPFLLISIPERPKIFWPLFRCQPVRTLIS